MPVGVAFVLILRRRQQGGACWVTRRLRASHTLRAHREARNLEAEAPQALGAEVGSGRTGGALGRLAEVLLVRGKASTRVIPTAPLRWWSWITMVVDLALRPLQPGDSGLLAESSPKAGAPLTAAARFQLSTSWKTSAVDSLRVGEVLHRRQAVVVSTALRSRRLITYLSCPI